VYHVDHVFCFSLRLHTLDPGNKAKVGGSSEGHPQLQLVILRLDSCITSQATETPQTSIIHVNIMNVIHGKNGVNYATII